MFLLKKKDDAVVVCGQIKSGNVKKGDEVEINSTSRDQQKTSVLSKYTQSPFKIHVISM